MSSGHDGSRGGSLEDIRVEDVEVDDPLQYNIQQVRRRWKAMLTVVATALTTYAIFWVEGTATVDVAVFGLFTVAALAYTVVMVWSDLELS